ncbi:MAG: SGNH/GDSL hydrolase family protein [Acutalibacteraceae bacterium]|nr:SGNH/GDSL hydrolase family protein [Acutalibacteraceae bacterium]
MFGFLGQAKGESVLAHWLATLPMSVFICDYDHNASTVEHLEATHYSMYKIIREKNPELPYIMISRPDYWTQMTEQSDILKRRDVIMSSYLKARQIGDGNIYFIDGLSFLLNHISMITRWMVYTLMMLDFYEWRTVSAL